MSVVDTVEIPVGVLRYLLDVAGFATEEADGAYSHAAKIHVEDPSVMDDVIDARALAICAGKHAAIIHDALNDYIPEDES